MSRRETPNNKALEVAILLVEWAVIARGKGLPHALRLKRIESLQNRGANSTRWHFWHIVPPREENCFEFARGKQIGPANLLLV